ncbi:GIY-YIG nuclease family protein [Candidatus Venteria ishoeyi]|uniref:UvrABC system protein C n=1 Tax=Candidatus Venteria ishoeyi TaxID=1899563 RepID=A0A1H6F6R1_9GAMM|nr:GIY-YIG nuclease family protein [Candidatus Venteria ishoeyi]SEH05091.1 UvrABC system protein C [Candidatus Venteria ishoeyi]
MNELLETTLKNLPHCPGVYKMMNSEGTVIYVGKAKDLAKRVRSYFQSKDHTIRIRKLIENIVDIQWIEVNSELEAFLLETNLIKEIMPKYNILMKDGKNFCYLKISLADIYPRVSIIRQMKKD